MKKGLRFILLPALLLCTWQAQAQFPYDLKVSRQLYKPLTSGVNLVSEVWFNSDYLPLPLEFGVSMDTVHCNAPYLAGGSTIVSDTAFSTGAIVSSFFLTDANLIDKGFLGSDLDFLSPIRYEVDGTPGGRIFKLEVANAAFFNEVTYGTQYDSLFMQIWLYETSNVIELRYGPSHISHGYNYFPNKGYPCIGYIQDVDSGLNGMYYILGGDPLNPFIEAITSVKGMLATKPSGLNAFPTNGTVYRFTPVKAGIHQNQNIYTENKLHVYPTTCTNELKIEYSTDNPASPAGYTLVNANGAIIFSNPILPNAITHIGTDQLLPGIYLLQMQTATGVKTERITKL